MKVLCVLLLAAIGVASAYYGDEYDYNSYDDQDSNADTSYEYNYQDGGYGAGGHDDYDSSYESDYAPAPRAYGNRQTAGGYGRANSYSPRKQEYGGRGRMDSYGRSGGTYGNSYQPRHVPVVIKKKKEKKRKIISSHSGFYIPGGTAVYGKFKDLHSCEKACELTPTCFAADFNPWLNKCYLHSNLTACQQMRAHSQITHFKKVPCTIVETPRGLITLGASSWNGLLQKGIDSLMDCIKACATAGGGVAPMPMMADDTPQLCFGIDYDFADHKCYFHISLAICGGDASTLAQPVTPVSLFKNPSVVNILICPIKPE